MNHDDMSSLPPSARAVLESMDGLKRADELFAEADAADDMALSAVLYRQAARVAINAYRVGMSGALSQMEEGGAAMDESMKANAKAVETIAELDARLMRANAILMRLHKVVTLFMLGGEDDDWGPMQ